jgi:hypothetical protein
LDDGFQRRRLKCEKLTDDRHSLHLDDGFQRRRLKCEKLTDDRQQTMDAR